MFFFQDENKTKFIPVMCTTILNNLSFSFVFDFIGGEAVKPEATDITLNLLEKIVRLSSSQSQSIICHDLLNRLLAKSFCFDDSTEVLGKFLTSFYHGFLNNNNQLDQISVDSMDNKFITWTEINSSITSLLRDHQDELIDQDENNIFASEVFYQYLYWPLTLTLARTDVSYSYLIFIFNFFFYKKNIHQT